MASVVHSVTKNLTYLDSIGSKLDLINSNAMNCFKADPN